MQASPRISPRIRTLPLRLPGRDDAVVWVPMAVASACGLWAVAVPSPWTDELVTMDVAQRSLPQLWALVHHADAVHGVYYLLVHAVGQIWGVSALTVRLPSVVAVAVAAGGVSLLGRRLGGRRLGWYAGLLFAVTPTASRYAQEARSYALVTAVAVFATWALLRAVDNGGRWPVWYAVLVAALGWLNLIGLLLVAAHVVTVALIRPPREVTVRLLAAAAAAAAAVGPLIVVGYRQQGTVGGAAPVNARTLAAFGGWLLAPGRMFAPLVLGVAVLLAAGSGWWYRRAIPREVAAVAVPWLAVPPLLLAAASLGRSYFADRYLLFCLPAVALLLGACCAVTPLLLRMVLVLTLTGPFVLAHEGIRREDSRPWNAAALAAVLRHEGRPGDGLLFDASPCRTIRSAYPRAFAPLTDVELGMSAAQRGWLHGSRVPEAVAVQRLKRLKRVWVISCRHLSAGGRRLAAQAAARHRRVLSAAGPFTVVQYRAVRGLGLTLYGRTAPGREGHVEQAALIAIENR